MPNSEILSLTSGSKCEEFAQFFNDKITSIRAGIVRNTSIPHDLPCNKPATMRNFNSICDADLYRITAPSKSSTCCLDPVPTKFFEKVVNSVSTPVLKIINTSLETGILPNAFKTAVVKPLLKKPNLDYNVVSNYRPISNLPYMSRILEKVVFNQLNNFLNENNTLEKYQSGFRFNHSTETALTKIVSDLRLLAANKVSVLILLDLSAAFDTIDHSILVDHLEKWVGLSERVVNWF